MLSNTEVEEARLVALEAFLQAEKCNDVVQRNIWTGVYYGLMYALTGQDYVSTNEDLKALYRTVERLERSIS